VTIRWDDSTMRSAYANVCDVTGTREEIVLLFGVNQSWSSSQRELVVPLLDGTRWGSGACVNRGKRASDSADPGVRRIGNREGMGGDLIDHPGIEALAFSHDATDTVSC
jgi:hypothetical protein